MLVKGKASFALHCTRKVSGNDDDLRHDLTERTVLLVDDAVVFVDSDEAAADYGAELADEFVTVHGVVDDEERSRDENGVSIGAR